VREARIELTTLEGLDRNQTAMLLLTGRTANQSRATQNPTVGANVGTAADVAGQASRDTIANLMEPYVDDNFYRLTGFNLRLTVGSDGFQGRVRKRITRYLTFQSDDWQGFYSNSRWTTRFDTWVRDYVSFGFRVEQLRTPSTLGVPETQPLTGLLELRLDYAIRR
jgi:hypothetical protein